MTDILIVKLKVNAWYHGVLRTICIAIIDGLIEQVRLCRMDTTTALGLYSLFTHPADSAYSIQCVCPLRSSLSLCRQTRGLPACRTLYVPLHETIQANALPLRYCRSLSELELPRASSTLSFVLRRTGRLFDDQS